MDEFTPIIFAQTQSYSPNLKQQPILEHKYNVGFIFHLVSTIMEINRMKTLRLINYQGKPLPNISSQLCQRTFLECLTQPGRQGLQPWGRDHQWPLKHKSSTQLYCSSALWMSLDQCLTVSLFSSWSSADRLWLLDKMNILPAL